MNATETEPLLLENFSVAVVYEDREMRDRALAVCRHMEAQAGGEIEFSYSWWKFEFLQDSELSGEAANAATMADMLVVSAQAGRGLPSAFTEWVETWLPRRGQQESVLVALIDPQNDPMSDAAIEYLRGVANRGRMDYLAKPLVSPSAPSNQRTDTALSVQTRTPPPVDHLKPVRPPSHWGINE
jgi:hypothetical protein